MAIFLTDVMKMSLRRGWVVLKSLKTPLRSIKMAPKATSLGFDSTIEVEIRC